MDEAAFIILMQDRMAAHKVSQTELAKIAGLPSQSAVSNLFKGKRRLRMDERAKIAAYLGIEEEPNIHWVPLIGLASAGAWAEATQVSGKSIPIMRRVAGPRAFAVTIKGDSMNLLLPEGGYAIVDPDQTSLYAGKVYVLENADCDTTVKRYKGDPARFEPVSNNPDHQPLDLSETQFRVIGRVVSYGSDDGL
jgi:SOS-response transcriptional repressor LexA